MPQSNTKKRSRTLIMLAVAAMLTSGLIYAFWPKPTYVDMGVATRSAMTLTIDEEARTRVRDAYVVSAPIAGRLMRVEVEPGDSVTGGETIIARMLPAAPSAMDVRTREQARASVNAAQAGLRVARADLNSAMASQDLADAQITRSRKLVSSGAISQASLDQATREKRAADAAVDTARAAISMREAELASARAQLIEFNDTPAVTGEAETNQGTAIPLHAPTSGRILRVMQESETIVAAGQPVFEIGDISNDLEVVAELISTDAVQVKTGDRVVIDNWGGQSPLNGIVQRVEPWGFTKFSALGVEEQRVNTIIRFTDPISERSSLGHGYRVEAQIVIWENEDALTVPSSALFRHAGGWAVFTVNGGNAKLTPVDIGQNNGVLAEITDGVSEDATLILYPGAGLSDGAKVKRRPINE